MKYNISYSCVSHIGNCRRMNQDNFICDGKYMNVGGGLPAFPLAGCRPCGQACLFGIFDGMGGEERGEVASLLAAKEAVRTTVSDRPVDDLLDLCRRANAEICQYASENQIASMGSTAALLAFGDQEIALCNIGDSKIFRFADKKLEQISRDHIVPMGDGRKPPLSQNLGIPPSEMVIEPYVALGKYNVNDIYIICSDGLTDMISEEEIARILRISGFGGAARRLLNKALSFGGRDNITIILCRVEKRQKGLLDRLF